MTEKLCLQWNDFKENARNAFGSLRDDQDFVDVTLACEDGTQMEAHKAILASSSPFFKNILKRNKHLHPLIYMRGLSSDTLAAILDFLYLGEANVSQENLDDFLALAAELKLKGLMEEGGDCDKPGTTEKVTNVPVQTIYKTDEIDVKIVAMPSNLDEYTHELDLKVKSLMEKSSNMILTSTKSGKQEKANICKVCGKEGQWVAIRDHIEANHLEGVSLQCNNCEKAFRSRSSLRMHKCKNGIKWLNACLMRDAGRLSSA